MSTSLYFLVEGTSTATDTLKYINVVGTATSGSATLVTTFAISGFADALGINPTANNYYIAGNSDSPSTIYRETFSLPANFGSPIVSYSSPGQDIGALATDNINNILYYTYGSQVFAYRGGASVQIYTLPQSNASDDGSLKGPSGALSAVYDSTESALYLAGTRDESYSNFGSSSVFDLTANYIFKISNLSPTVTSGTAGFTSIAVPLNFGAINEIALDTANDTLYFTTSPVDFNSSNVEGLYSYHNGTFSTIWSLPYVAGTSTPALEFTQFDNMKSLTIDPLTGDYYIDAANNTDTVGTIYAGNVTSSSLPTAMMTITGSPIAIEIVDPPAPPTITVSATGSQALQGGGSISVLSGAPTVTDTSGSLTRATITLGGYVSGDVLGINGSTAGTFDGKITYSASNGVLSFSGTDTLAEYSALLNEVTFQDGGSEAASNAHPTHSLSWVVGDASQTSSTATTTITIDRAPATSAESASLVAGAAVTGSALTGITDPDGDSLSVSAITGGVVGSPLSGTYGALTLSANGSYNYSASNSTAIANAATGSAPVDHFTFTVSDGKGGTAVETLSITIDRAPNTSAGATASLAAGATVTGAALTGITDPDGDSVSITAVAGGGVGTGVSGTYGVLTISSNGSYTYAANNSAALAAAATGSDPVDHFTFNVSDGKGGVSTETLTVSIDRAPIIAAGGANAALVAGGVVTGAALTGDTDPDGDSLTISSISGGALGSALSGTYGVVTLNANGSYLYSANNSAALAAAATGSAPVDHFTFTVTDGHGVGSLETLAVTIDRAPIITSGGASATALAGANATGGAGAALAGDSDPDGDSLTITAIAGGILGTGATGTYGQLTLNSNGSYVYSASNSAAIAAAPTGSAPVDQFIYAVSDGKGGTSNETLSITIDRAPIVSSVSLSALENYFVSGNAGAALAGDSDPDGRALSIGTVTGAGGSVAADNQVAGNYGTLELNTDGSYFYAANNNASAAPSGTPPVDVFTFSVIDGSGAATQETLSITVNRPPSMGTGPVVTYTAGAGAVTVDATGTVNDPDNANITGATLYTTNGNLPGDVLSFTPQFGITGSFANGTLSLTGDASAADYQTVLQSVQYSSTDADPYANGANPFRTVAIILTDAYGSSQPSSAFISISQNIDIPAGSLTSLGSFGVGRDAIFTGTGAILALTDPAGFNGFITALDGNTIDLAGLAIASETYGSGVLSLYDSANTLLETLTLTEPGSITSADFHLAGDGTGGTDLTLCFFPGTRIATPTGEVAVEDLQPGDLVLTSDGPAPLRWVGRSEIATRFANKLRTLPIRITAGALGDNLPQRDLLLSPDHALFMENCLIQAAALINHTTIRRETNVPEHFTYYHLELDHHALLFAEGALAESFVDNVDRMHFHNWDARTTPTTPILELPYPRAKSARQLPLTLRWIHAA